MKLVQFILILLLFKNAFTQNKSYELIDSIRELSETNYLQAKKEFLKLIKTNEVDPAEKLIFYTTALTNNDIKFYKRSMIKMVKEHGFSYTRINRFTKSINPQLRPLLVQHNLENWLIECTEKYHPYWVKKNPIGDEVQQEIAKLIEREEARKYLFQLSLEQVCDSIRLKQIEIEFHLENLELLFQLINNLDVLPNHFDHGVDTYFQWQFILLHAMYPQTIYSVWERILPKVEEAYFKGKISSGLFHLYDIQLNLLFGFQYYGFLKDVPIKDEKNLLERKRKYGFL